jgi:hypothetical protein
MDPEYLQEVSEAIMKSIFEFSNRKSYTIPIRYVISKLIKKFDGEYVRKMIPEKDQKVVHYIEKMRRKDGRKKRKGVKKDHGESSADSDDDQLGSDNEKQGTDKKKKGGDTESEDSSSDGGASSDGEVFFGDDDIPRVRNIPVVSDKDPSKEGKKGGMRGKNIAQIMEMGEQQYETHFTENPFIKLKEKKFQKVVQRQTDKEHKAKSAELFISKESGKFVIKETHDDRKGGKFL